MLRSVFLAGVLLAPSIGSGRIPTFEVIVPESKVDFHVKASVALTGVFEKWAASLRFTTPYVQNGVLEIVVQAASVNAGSSLKEGKLKGNDFFAVKEHPEITFRSKKIVLTGPDSYRVDGEFTIRGLTKEESLTLHYTPNRPDEGRIQGEMVFDRSGPLIPGGSGPPFRWMWSDVPVGSGPSFGRDRKWWINGIEPSLLAALESRQCADVGSRRLLGHHLAS